jgi:pimeloyl-ACP methyl ester carboxylesterase
MMLISGTGRQAREFEVFKGAYHPHRDIARALLAAGIGVIRFDERSTGASTGDHRTARSADLRNDAHLIFKEASEVAGVDKRRMYIFGHSEGAIFAMQLAHQEPLVAGIAVAGTPFKSGREMTWDQVKVETARPAGMSDQQFSSYLQEVYTEKVKFVLGRPSLADLFDFDGKKVASNVRCPTLVLEGMEDWQVRPPQGKQAARAMQHAGNRHVTYIPLTGVGHLLTPNPPGVTDYELLSDYGVDRRVTSALVGWTRSVAGR